MMYIIIIILLLTNIAFICIDIIPYILHKYKSRQNNILIKSLDITSYSAMVKIAAFNMIKSKKVIMSYRKQETFIIEYRKIKGIIKNKLKGNKDNDWVFGWNKSFLYNGLISLCNDDELMNVQLYFDRFYINTDGKPKFVYKTVHQTPFALAALKLYQRTKDNKYAKFCDLFFQSLVKWKEEDGTIKYFAKQNTPWNYHFIDEIGMYIPFLIEYYKTFNNNEALEIAVKNIDFWCSNLDSNYLPMYNSINGYNLGLNNWGRGCSWFILALLPMIDTIGGKYIEIGDKLIRTLDNLMLKDNVWGQFLGTPSHIDSSSTIPFLLLKFKLNKISKYEVHKVLSNLTNYKGEIISCSGETYGINRFSEIFGTSEFIQGITLELLTEIKKYK